jgi:hypothetical protein
MRREAAADSTLYDMARPVHVREILKHIDLAWWPEFLLQEVRSLKDEGEDTRAHQCESSAIVRESAQS